MQGFMKGTHIFIAFYTHHQTSNVCAYFELCRKRFKFCMQTIKKTVNNVSILAGNQSKRWSVLWQKNMNRFHLTTFSMCSDAESHINRVVESQTKATHPVYRRLGREHGRVQKKVREKRCVGKIERKRQRTKGKDSEEEDKQMLFRYNGYLHTPP